MSYAAFILATLLLFTVNGISFQLLCIKSDRQLSAAPIVGSCILAISTTIFYRFGVAPIVTISVVSAVSTAAALSLSLITLIRCKTNEWSVGVAGYATLVCFIAIFFLILLPHVIGGENFSVFQGNPHDTFNYLSAAVGYATHNYSDLHHESIRSSATLIYAASTLSARPAVSLLYAGIYRLFGLDYLTDAYDFCSALQINLFFAMLYLTRTLFPLRPIATAVASATFGIGFFAQYVFDINAWSESLALPMFIILIVDFTRLLVLSGRLSAPPTVPELASQLGRITIVAAGLVYSYPEMASMAVLACAGTLASAFLIYMRVGSIRLIGRLSFYCGISALAVVGIVSFYWQGTVGFLQRQIAFATEGHVTWQMFFQAYFMGSDQNNFIEMAGQGSWWTKPYTLLSLPSDFLSGLMGLYFLQPSRDVPLWIRVIYKLFVLSGCFFIVVGVARTIGDIFSKKYCVPTARQRQLRYVLILAAYALLIPAYLLARGQYWSAGKATSMASPFIFLVLVMPIFLPTRFDLVRIFSWGIIAAHILFGIYRPYAVWTEGNGLFYKSPYPIFLGPLKTASDWDISRHHKTLVRCKLVKVEISNPFLEREVENYLIDQKIQWATSRPQKSYYDSGEDIGIVNGPMGQREDCLLTDLSGQTNAAPIVIDLRRQKNN